MREIYIRPLSHSLSTAVYRRIFAGMHLTKLSSLWCAWPIFTKIERWWIRLVVRITQSPLKLIAGKLSNKYNWYIYIDFTSCEMMSDIFYRHMHYSTPNNAFMIGKTTMYECVMNHELLCTIHRGNEHLISSGMKLI